MEKTCQADVTGQRLDWVVSPGAAVKLSGEPHVKLCHLTVSQNLRPVSAQLPKDSESQCITRVINQSPHQSLNGEELACKQSCTNK